MLEIKSHILDRSDYTYTIFYELVEYPDDGYHFICNMQGEINFNDLTPQAEQDYEKCMNDEYEVIYRGLVRHEKRIYEPAIGICSCGREVVLKSTANECSCGLKYNQCGQAIMKGD